MSIGQKCQLFTAKRGSDRITIQLTEVYVMHEKLNGNLKRLLRVSKKYLVSGVDMCE